MATVPLSLPRASSDHLTSLKRPSSSSSSSSSSTSSKDTPVIVQPAHSIAGGPGTLPPSPPLPLLNSSNRQSNLNKHRQSTQSIAPSKQSRGGLFSLAALARDRTSSAIANFSEPSIRHRLSSSSLYRTAQSSPTTESSSSSPYSQSDTRDNRNRDNSNLSKGDHNISNSFPSNNRSDTLKNSTLQNSLFETNPPSQAYSNTASNTPAPIALPPTNFNKMHQTSSRLLRMTDGERPFTRDFKDLFATLVVSLPLAPHRVRLTRIEHSFLAEEAINNLGSLKFSQSNRMPDPKDTSRIVTTTTTTTFSMAREMARSVCQRFLDGRFIESADGKHAKEFTMKNSVWQLTPKGIHILERFCSKNGIQQKHITELVNSSRNTMQLVILERDSTTDSLSADRSTIEVIFRRFIGQNGPNVKNSTSSADSDSLSEYKDGLAGVKMANERKIGTPVRTMYQTFTGKAATDWLMDCCTTVDRQETSQIATLFLEQELIWCVQQDRAFLASFSPQERERALIFQPTKHAIYQMTQKGKDVVNMTSRERTSESGEGSSSAARAGVSRDSNTQKLDKILNDASLRLLFRENLRDTHCEENLSFYLDVDEFLKSCKIAIKSNSPSRGSSGNNLDSVKETMASAYGIYNAFLAPGSPCELNIDHLLRNQLATRMTKAVGQDSAMIESLKEVTKLFEEAQLSVFKLMASDSVPKFMKSSKYEQTLKTYDFDSIAPRTNASGMPERAMSRSGRSNI
ncbi:related to developmental regulator flbA [Rhynchosporium secalis]|uniref:Related to developmental regulator flbA n=1 Tax=Rhynchosporium secalis TaxID=38038 RepID=A0A1E1M432_RHYSE|nr:related to developmental regulator flbA [Rhynchosporium secalis]